jgi:membrane-associated phospholipid phosphatase
MDWMHTITGTGDLAVLIPLIGILSVWLLLTRQLAALCWWNAAVAICAGVTAILKIYFYVCPPAVDFSNPSGHTSLSTLVYGALTLLILRSVIGWRRYVVAFLGAALVFSIGISRLLLHAHSLPEVLFGWLIGLLTLWFFARAFGLRAYPYFRPLIAACVIIIVSMTGQEVRAENLLHALGLHLLDRGLTCMKMRPLAMERFYEIGGQLFELSPARDEGRRAASS